MNRNQKGSTTPSAVRANLDDPPIHIRPIVPASAGAKDKNPVGSGHYGTLNIAPRLLNRNGFLCRKCQESGGKGLKIDRRPLPSSAKLLAINGKTQIVSGYKPFDGSYEFREMIKVVRNMAAPRAKRHRSPSAT
jgi:hypothetical protein